MAKFFIIPGYGNSGDEHWQTYFETKLDNCSRINQDSWDHPTCDDWVNGINDSLANEDLSNSILITHSLGCLALVHWVNRFGKKPKGAMIVAPPDLENPYQDLNLESFTPIPLNKLNFSSIVVRSSNDHWSSMERSKLFSDSWGSKLITLDNAGHINTDSGYGKWDQGLEILNELL
jgi:uncharacterized protein